MFSSQARRPVRRTPLPPPLTAWGLFYWPVPRFTGSAKSEGVGGGSGPRSEIVPDRQQREKSVAEVTFVAVAVALPVAPVLGHAVGAKALESPRGKGLQHWVVDPARVGHAA